MDSFPGGYVAVTGSIKGKARICLEWQYVMLPRCQIELKVKLSYQSTWQMRGRNEKIRRDEDSSSV